MIPLCKSRKGRKTIKIIIHTQRTMLKRCFAKLKNSRRQATCSDKLQTASSMSDASGYDSDIWQNDLKAIEMAIVLYGGSAEQNHRHFSLFLRLIEMAED